MPTRIVIMGAAGRDFHNFNTVFRDDEDYEVVAFTATQIPYIDEPHVPGRAGRPALPRRHPDPRRVASCPSSSREHEVDQVVFAYSRRPARVRDAQGLARARAAAPTSACSGPTPRMVEGTKPVDRRLRRAHRRRQEPDHAPDPRSCCAKAGEKVVAVRHPMPYGDLVRQARAALRRPSTDLDRHECTIEEMEEYEPHVVAGNVIYAGVDYEAILREAEKEADVILWDGGNNDLPFYQARPRDLRRRPAPARPRAALLPRRGQPAPGRRGRHQQDRHRRPRAASTPCSPPCARSTRRPRSSWRASPLTVDEPGADHAASACSWSRTAPRSPTAG